MSRPTLSSVAAAVAFGLCILARGAASGHQNAALVGDSGGTAQVVNGVMTKLYPAVGALLLGDQDSARAWCTGTLIGCRTFLTAAHCVCPTDGDTCLNMERPNPSAYTVFFQHAGFADVERIVVHPEYQYPHADLAILTLARPMTNLRPVPINNDGSPAPDTVGTIVGFGRSGGENSDYGIKREGRVTIDASMVGQGDGLLGWYFRGPLGDPGSNANTCSGDSGGPLLIPAHDGWMLAGTTSGGQNGACLTDDVSIDTDVYMFHEWIREVAGSDVTDGTCDTTPADGADTQDFSSDAVLEEIDRSMLHQIDVPDGATQLLITMNGIDDGRTNFDLDVRGPVAANAPATRCARYGSSQFAACELSAPAAGTWEVEVHRIAGSGPFQVNAVVVSRDCRRAENEGRECNDGDLCTDDDVCRSGECIGTPDASNDPSCAPRSCQPTPMPDCRQSTFSAPPLLTYPRSARGSSFTWRWAAPGARSRQQDYGDPTAGTEYAFCVYNEENDASLLLQAALPPGADWHKYGRGFSYRGNQPRRAGVSQARLRTAMRSRTTIVVRGAGLNSLARMSRMNHNLPIRVQLQSDRGCWETQQMLTERARASD